MKQQPQFSDINLTKEQWDFTDKILDSDALAAQLITRIKRQQPTSVIRMSDGERGFIALSKGANRTWYMNDDWLREYGLAGLDTEGLKNVGKQLCIAGYEADYLACTISGVYWDDFNVHQYFPNRKQFISSFYVRAMAKNDTWKHVLNQAPVYLLHRNHTQLENDFRKRYPASPITSLKLDSWKDQENVTDWITGMGYCIVLVSGGPSAKAWIPDLAKKTGCCVLDVGAGLANEMLDTY